MPEEVVDFKLQVPNVCIHTPNGELLKEIKTLASYIQ
jgi:hypothetical protein